MSGRVARAAGLTFGSVPGKASGYVALALGGAALPAASAWLTKLVLDGIGRSAPAGQLVMLALALALVGTVAAALPAVRTYLRSEIDRRVQLVAKDRLYRAVDRFGGLSRFEEPSFVDRLRLAEQSVSAPAGLVDSGLGIGQAAVTVVSLVGSLLVISPGMTLALLLAAVPVLLAELSLARRRAAMQWRLGPTERREMFYGQLLSSVNAAMEVRLFGLGGFLRGRMLAEARTSNAARRAVDRRQAVSHTGLGLLAALVAGAGLVWAILAAGRGELTVGDIGMFVAAVAGVQAALGAIASGTAVAHQELLSFEHYLIVVDAGPDLPEPATPTELAPLRKGIELDDVWFRYSPDHDWVLRGVNLVIPYGQAVGLVGRNGAGKSTLVKLLCRFYDPTRGTIRWDGVDLRDIPLTELRARISGVFQEYMNYELSAQENVGLGNLPAVHDRTRVRAAAVRAGIDEPLAALPHGYDTLLSRIFMAGDDVEGTDRGVMLSRGQWQRVALARAFMRDRRDLMILDEPSAGLDARAEYEVHSELRAHRIGQTSVLVSHRLGAIRDADLIVVLADGVVAETGDHATLMAATGAYADLFTLQAAGYQEIS